MGAEFAERREDNKFAGAGDHRLVFELPGVFVRDVDGVEADLHGRVDVAARAVADHPTVRFHDFVFAHEFAVSFGTFLGNNFDELEEALQAGTLDFGGLFGGLALGEENQAVALGEIGKRFGDAIEDFWRRALEINDAGVNLSEHLTLRHVFRELQIGFLERSAEAAHTVAVLANVFALRFVQDVADVCAREAAGLDKSDEILDELLKEDIVLPECIVGIDEQGLAAHAFSLSLFLSREHPSVYQRQRIFGDVCRGVGTRHALSGFLHPFKSNWLIEQRGNLSGAAEARGAQFLALPVASFSRMPRATRCSSPKRVK
jgi:hypothetical protein